MERSQSSTRALLVCPWALVVTAVLAMPLPGPVPPTSSHPTPTPKSTSAQAATLGVTLTLEHNTIAQPFPARVTLHFHNAGPNALWLYRHVRDPEDLARAQRRVAQINAAGGSSSTGSATAGGSSLVVHLDPAASTAPAAQSWTEPPHGKVMASIAMPHPRLVKLPPGGDDTEGAVVALNPAVVSRGSSDVALWGHYRFSVTYKTAYWNGDALSRDLGVDIWQGEISSSAVDVDLEPAPAFASGSISGRVLNANGQLLPGMQVSLSDGQSHVIGQIITGADGDYTFDHLPWGTYWATARPLDPTVETAAYDHVELSGGASKATLNLVPLETEAYEPKQLWHKPVLIRVTGTGGASLGDVAVEALYTSGTVAENVKGETDSDGTVALDLIPGHNYVTLKHHKCANQDVRVDVAEGDGIDGSILQYDCAER